MPEVQPRELALLEELAGRTEQLWGDCKLTLDLLISTGGAREESARGGAAGPGILGGAGGPHRAAVGRAQQDHLRRGGPCCAQPERCARGRSRRPLAPACCLPACCRYA